MLVPLSSRSGVSCQDPAVRAGDGGVGGVGGVGNTRLFNEQLVLRSSCQAHNCLMLKIKHNVQRAT